MRMWVGPVPRKAERSREEQEHALERWKSPRRVSYCKLPWDEKERQFLYFLSCSFPNCSSDRPGLTSTRWRASGVAGYVFKAGREYGCFITLPQEQRGFTPSSNSLEAITRTSPLQAGLMQCHSSPLRIATSNEPLSASLSAVNVPSSPTAEAHRAWNFVRRLSTEYHLAPAQPAHGPTSIDSPTAGRSGKSGSRLERQPLAMRAKNRGNDSRYSAPASGYGYKSRCDPPQFGKPGSGNRPNAASAGVFREFCRDIDPNVRRAGRPRGNGVPRETLHPRQPSRAAASAVPATGLSGAFPVRSRRWLSRDVMACCELVGITTKHCFCGGIFDLPHRLKWVRDCGASRSKRRHSLLFGGTNVKSEKHHRGLHDGFVRYCGPFSEHRGYGDSEGRKISIAFFPGQQRCDIDGRRR